MVKNTNSHRHTHNLTPRNRIKNGAIKHEVRIYFQKLKQTKNLQVQKFKEQYSKHTQMYTQTHIDMITGAHKI